MLSVRRASRWFGSALLLSVALASQVHAMPVIGELQRLQGAVRQEDSASKRAEPPSDAKAIEVAEIRKSAARAVADAPATGLLRLDQQTLILVVAGFAAALSLMARLR
jgi:hypothetical protein